MDLLKGVFHFTMMFFGATIRLDTVKHPNLLMLINRVFFITYLMNLMI